MPKGYPNKPKDTLDPEAISHAPDAQSTAAPKALRSREEQAADEYTAEFLKNNRVDLSTIEKKLTFFGEKPGWVRYWPVDQGSRIQNLLARGWRFVKRAEVGMSDSIGRGNTDIGDQVSTVTTAGDGPVRQVLMEIPEQLYRMYAEARIAPARATVEAIKAGGFVGDLGDASQNTAHAYNPGATRGSALYGTQNRIESKSA